MKIVPTFHCRTIHQASNFNLPSASIVCQTLPFKMTPKLTQSTRPISTYMPQNKATPADNSLLSICHVAVHFALFSCNFQSGFRLPARNPTLSHFSTTFAPPFRLTIRHYRSQTVNNNLQLLVTHNNNTTSNHSHNTTTHLYTNYTHSDHSIRAHKFHFLSHLHTLQSPANDCKISTSYTIVINSQQLNC